MGPETEHRQGTLGTRCTEATASSRLASMLAPALARSHRSLAWASLACGLLAGCPLAPINVAEGGPCVRSTQCSPGLVCSAAGVCTSDLTGFGMGMVPNTDVPMDLDAGDLDAGAPMDTPGMDTPGMDVPVIPMDVPVVPMDVPMAPDVPVDTGVDSGMPDVPMTPDVPVIDEDTGVEDAG